MISMSLQMAERELLTNGIAAEQIHCLSLDDADAELHHVHDVQSLMKKDVIHSAEIGALIGIAASIIAITAAYLSGLASKVGWAPFVFLAIVLLGFFTWEGGLIGIQTPNSRFRRFRESPARRRSHILRRCRSGAGTDREANSRVASAVATRGHRHVVTALDRRSAAPDTTVYSMGSVAHATA